jgi:hypothetical protein
VEAILAGNMRRVVIGIALLAGAGLGMSARCGAQDYPLTRRPKAAPERSACSYVTRAEAEAVVGGALEPGVPDAKARSCRYLEAGWGKDPAAKRQVSIAIARSYFQNASDVNIRREALGDDHSVSPMVVKELSGFGDAALWVWAGGYLGVLYAYRDGTTEVTVKIGGVGEEAALAAAKKFAVRVLGSAEATGYRYAAPAATIATKGYFMPEILKPLYEGDFEQVRDDEQARRYVVAVIAGVNASCGKMPEDVAVMQYGFHSAWKRDGLKAEAAKDYGAAFAGQMERLRKSSPEILREGDADGRLFVKENDGCGAGAVQHLEGRIVAVAGERRGILPVDWR